MRRTLCGTKHRRALIGIGALAISFPAMGPGGSVVGQDLPRTVRPLQIEDLSGMKHLDASGGGYGGAVAITPDGRQVAAVVCDPRRVVVDPDQKQQRMRGATGAPSGTQGCDIWISATGGGRAEVPTKGEGANWAPAWSPDGRTLAFASDRGGAPQLWVWSAEAPAIRRVSTAVLRNVSSIDLPQWTPDGRRLLVKLKPDGGAEADQKLDGGELEATTQDDLARRTGSTVQIQRSVVSPAGASTGRAPEAEAPRGTMWLGDLALVDVASGRVQVLTRGAHVAWYGISPTGTHAAWLNVRARTTASAWWDVLTDLTVVDLTTGGIRILARDVRQFFGGAINWSPDGTMLAYVNGKGPRKQVDEQGTHEDDSFLVGELTTVSLRDGTPRALHGASAPSFDAYCDEPVLWDARGEHVYMVGEHRVWRADVRTGEIAPLTAASRVHVQEVVGTATGRIWAPEDGALYALTVDAGTMQAGAARIALDTGAVTIVRQEDKDYRRRAVGALRGGEVVVLVQSAAESGDLWIASQGFTRLRRLSTINPGLEGTTFGRSRLIHFRSQDGTPLKAALLLPAGYVEGRRYPLIVWSYASRYTSKGVNVFGMYCDGQMFATRGYAVMQPDVPVHIGSPVQDLMKAVMPAVDRVIELGIADPDRLATIGQSNAGYSTLALITQTHRFKAAVMNAGFGDLTGFYLANWILWCEEEGGAMGAPPWEAPLRYVTNSPVYYLDRVETPLLMQAGGADNGIVEFSDQVFVGLHRLGRDVTYLRYAGEGHVLEQAGNRVDYWTRVIEFLDDHLKPQVSSAAGAP